MQTLEDKLKKRSGIIAAVSLVIGAFLLLDFIVSLIALLWLLISSPESSQFYQFLLIALHANSKGVLCAEISIDMVSALMLMLIIRHAYLFFKSTKNNARPFKADNIIKLKKAGIGMIVYAFVEVIARKGFYASFADSAPASQVPDPAFIIAALLLFAIALIFEYGALLQQLSDETL